MPTLERALTGRRILLTGATGFLGKTFLYVLLRHHPEIERIYLLIRGDRRSSQNRYQREVVDSPALGPLRTEMGARFDDTWKIAKWWYPRRHLHRRAVGEGVDPFKRGRSTRWCIAPGLVNFEASLEKAMSSTPSASPT